MRDVRAKAIVAACFLILTVCSYVALHSESNRNLEPLEVVSSQSAAAALPPELLAYFDGDWKGQGHFRNGKELRSELSFTSILEDQAILVRHKEESPHTFQFVALLTMDSGSGNPVLLLASNHESGGRLFRSRGWHDGKVVFESVPELRASFALERLTFERETDNSFGSTYEFSADGGKSWRVGDHQRFEKRLR